MEEERITQFEENVDEVGLDWNALFRVDKIVGKKINNNKCIIQVLAHISRCLIKVNRMTKL